MNSFETLFFPETTIFNEKRYPLLLFFTPLHFLQVVESGPESVPDAEAELFLKSGLCQAHTPAPLGDNRTQFLKLIRGIGEGQDSLTTRPKKLTTTSPSALAGNESDTIKQSIVASLLRQYGVEHSTTGTEMQLWQARVVLALAEIFDNQEEALGEQLSFFNKDEIAAFRSLKGAADPNKEDLFNELADITAQLENSHSGGMSKRFEAWLLLLQNQPVVPVKVWLASTRDSANQLFDRYESSGHSHAVPLLKLSLPAQIEASGKYALAQIEEFQRKTMPIHQGIVADFQRISETMPYVDGDESLLPYSTDWAEQWEGALHDFFPISNHGRQDATFYLLPNQPIERLLSLPERPDAKDGGPAHGLLAVLGTAQTT
jgi:hypothetical protein